MGQAWHARRGDRKVGPVALPTLEKWASLGRLRPSDQVLQQGTTEWQLASEVIRFTEPTNTQEEQIRLVISSTDKGHEPEPTSLATPSDSGGPQKSSSLTSHAAAAVNHTGAIVTWLKIVLVSLPEQYHKLGQIAYEDATARDAFHEHFSAIEELRQQISSLKQDGKPTTDEFATLTGRLVAALRTAKRTVLREKLLIAHRAALRGLGEAVAAGPFARPISPSTANELDTVAAACRMLEQQTRRRPKNTQHDPPPEFFRSRCLHSRDGQKAGTAAPPARSPDSQGGAVTEFATSNALPALPSERSPADQTQWYIRKNGKDHGPVRSATLKRLATLDKLSPGDLIRRQDQKAWCEARAMKEIFAVTPHELPPSANAHVPSPLPLSKPISIAEAPTEIARSGHGRLKKLGVCMVLMIPVIGGMRGYFQSSSLVNSEQEDTSRPVAESQRDTPWQGAEGKETSGISEERLTVVGSWTSVIDSGDYVKVEVTCEIDEAAAPEAKPMIREYVRTTMAMKQLVFSCLVDKEEWSEVEKAQLVRFTGTVTDRHAVNVSGLAARSARKIVMRNCAVEAVGQGNDVRLPPASLEYLRGYESGYVTGLSKRDQADAETYPVVQQMMIEDIENLVSHYRQKALELSRAGGHAERLEGIADGMGDGFYSTDEHQQ